MKLHTLCPRRRRRARRFACATSTRVSVSVRRSPRCARLKIPTREKRNNSNNRRIIE